MRDIDAAIDEVSGYFDDILCEWPSKHDDYDMEKDQPKHFSWVHIWASAKGLATSEAVGITYTDAEEFQQEVVSSVRRFFNTNTLQLVIDGKLTMFGMQIGPEQPGGGDINDELGLEVSHE